MVSNAEQVSRMYRQTCFLVSDQEDFMRRTYSKKIRMDTTRNPQSQRGCCSQKPQKKKKVELNGLIEENQHLSKWWRKKGTAHDPKPLSHLSNRVSAYGFSWTDNVVPDISLLTDEYWSRQMHQPGGPHINIQQDDFKQTAEETKEPSRWALKKAVLKLWERVTRRIESLLGQRITNTPKL